MSTRSGPITIGAVVNGYDRSSMADGVHQAHCCGHHGCKYGDERCPVATGAAQQEHPCIHCMSPEEARYALIEALDEYSWSCILFSRLFPDRVRRFRAQSDA